jgi:hypothetical protein
LFNRKKNKKKVVGKANNKSNTTRSASNQGTAFGSTYGRNRSAGNSPVNIYDNGYGSSQRAGNGNGRGASSTAMGQGGRQSLGNAGRQQSASRQTQTSFGRAVSNQGNTPVSIYDSDVRETYKKITQRKNKNAIRISVLMFCLVFTYMACSVVNAITKKTVQYDTIQYGTIDTPNVVQGVIIRDERVYTTPAAGMVEYECSDNEKVKKNTVVCNVMDAEKVAAMEKSLEDINESILKIQSERGDLSIYSEDVKKTNERIKTTVEDAVGDLTKHKLTKLYEFRDNVEAKMDERNQLLLSESKGSDLTNLVTQRKAQLSKIDDSISKVTANDGGIVSYFVDGKEEEYTPAELTKLTKKQTQINASSARSEYKTTVKAGDTLFKIVKSNDWYIAAYISSEQANEWEQGDLIRIYVKDEDGDTHSLVVTVNSITATDSEDEKYVTLKATRDMLDFIGARSVTFETETSFRGYKVPNSAIVEETLMKIPDGYITEDSLVYKVNGDNTEEVSVVVSGGDSENNISYVPVQLGVLNVGDTIKNPESGEAFTISEVLNTKGIYVVNSGIAEFKTINMDGSNSNSTHTVLDDSKNTNIYIYDRIMTNTENIKKEQKVYE